MIRIIYDNVTTIIENVTPQLDGFLTRELRYENDYRVRQQAAQARGIHLPKYTYLFKIKRNRNVAVIDSGLVFMVLNFLEQQGLEYIYEEAPSAQYTFPTIDDAKAMVKTLGELDPPITLRSYQKRAVFASMSNKRGIFYLATGLGKTAVLASMIVLHNKRTLIMCQSVDLARQLTEEIEFYTGLSDVGFIGDGIFDPKHITVGLVQTLNPARKMKGKGKKKKDQILEYLESVEAVFVDECHNAQAKGYSKALENMPNAVLRYGFSATPFTSMISCEPRFDKASNKFIYKDQYNILLESLFGPFLLKMSTIDGVNAGYLARPEIVMVDHRIKPTSPPRKSDYDYEYSRYIVENEERNDLICSILKESYDAGERAVVFVIRLDHAQLIIDKLVALGIDPNEISYVNGQISKEERKAALFSFKSNDAKIIIGTVLKEGLNFQCDIGINAAAGVSDRAAIQCLGRILRKARDPILNDVNTEVEEHVRFYDFNDYGHKFFETQAIGRLEIFEQEGHNIRRVSDEDPFNK